MLDQSLNKKTSANNENPRGSLPYRRDSSNKFNIGKKQKIIFLSNNSMITALIKNIIKKFDLNFRL